MGAAGRSLVAGPFEIGFEWMTSIAALLGRVEGRPSDALSSLAEVWDVIAPVRYLQDRVRRWVPTSCGWQWPPLTTNTPSR